MSGNPVIYANTNWEHFLNASVNTAVCATTVWIILTMLNYKVMKMCTKNLISIAVLLVLAELYDTEILRSVNILFK